MTNTPVTPSWEIETPSPATIPATPSSTVRPATPSPELELTTLPPTPFIVNGFVIYGVNINDEEQIYALQPGGTSRFVTAGQLLYGQAFSPDENKIIVDTNDRLQPLRSPDMVLIFDLGTGELLPLNFLSYPTTVFWSRDSTSLLYIARYSDEAPDQLVLYDVATGENQVLIEMEDIFHTAGWSVDGQTVAFVAKLDGQYDLFTVNSETLEKEQLTNTLDIETMVLWSPAEPELLVGTVLDERSVIEGWPWGVESLYLFDADNDNWKLIADKNVTSESVSWSPDGKKIAVAYAHSLCIENLETAAEICPLADGEPINEYFVSFRTRPVWSANGDWIAFYGIDQPCIKIFFVEIDTNTVVPGDLGCHITQISSSSPIYWSFKN